MHVYLLLIATIMNDAILSVKFILILKAIVSC